MIARLLAVAEGIRSRSPELWSPYVETAVDVTRAAAIPGSYVGGAVQCGRIALAAARAGNEVLVVRAFGALTQALFFAEDLDEARRNALEVVERPEAASRPFGYLGARADCRPGTDSAEPHTTRGGKRRLDGGIQRPPGREVPLGAWAR